MRCPFDPVPIVLDSWWFSRDSFASFQWLKRQRGGLKSTLMPTWWVTKCQRSLNISSQLIKHVVAWKWHPTDSTDPKIWIFLSWVTLGCAWRSSFVSLLPFFIYYYFFSVCRGIFELESRGLSSRGNLPESIRFYFTGRFLKSNVANRCRWSVPLGDPLRIPPFKQDLF